MYDCFSTFSGAHGNPQTYASIHVTSKDRKTQNRGDEIKNMLEFIIKRGTGEPERQRDKHV